MNEKYLRQLSKQFPNRAAVATEIVNLSAILNLPKGTEHYMTDIHGEYEQFTHVLRNGSGAVRRKIDEVFGDELIDKDKRQLATLVYYPEEKMKMILSDKKLNAEEWYNVTLHRLIKLTKKASSKYTRSKVRKALPKDFAYIMEELLSDRSDIADQEGYYSEIFHDVIRIGRARELVVAFCEVIRAFTVDHLHIIGDIYDRGPAPHLVMDDLRAFKNVDIQWGNHDVVWMGAAAGNPACVATVLRICARYGNLDILEQGYGISALPLVRFAMKAYANDPCPAFPIKYSTDQYDQMDETLDMKIHKAITIIQFKVEGQMIKRHPEYNM
ncbi:MAG: fructose-bisphosphatase class III, partial [Lachnospiraceae bacterium]|nr:fructose-bisphosphatase class III [Lachnospiraceae bacterium]